MPSSASWSTVLLCVAILGGCDRLPSPRPPDPQLLATDVHIAVAGHSLVLPFVALEDHALGEKSFTLDTAAEWKRTAATRAALLRDTRDPAHPLALDVVTVAVHIYDHAAYDRSAGQLCSRFSRLWARAICEDSPEVIRRALPRRFTLVDLSRLRLEDPRGPANCLRDRKRGALPSVLGLAALACPALVYGGDEDEFHTAVVRIDGELGAVWTVWRNGQGGESAEAMAVRQGQAITLFVETALGEWEDYPRLTWSMRPLQDPALTPHP
jgi:hypothetical protein